MADRTTGPQGSGGGGGGQTPPRRGFFTRNPLFLGIVAVLALLAISNYLNTHNQVELTYSQFREEVERVPVRPQPGPEGRAPASQPTTADSVFGRDPQGMIIGPQTIIGKWKPSKESKVRTKVAPDLKGYVEFRVEKGTVKDEEMIALLSPRGIDYKFDRASDWGTYLIIALPILLFLAFFMMMFRSSRMTGENVLSFGRSRAKIVGEDKTGVTFEDVAGADEAKEELKEIVEFLKEPDRFTALGGKIPRGVLLVGAPGCGKTLLARAVAGEAGVPFFSISGSDFVEMFVGVGAARVRDLFNTAKQKAPCIIFVDEIDAVGRHRGAGLGGGHDEREQTLNQLLVEMDGFDPRKGVIIIAATNRPDILDPALLRPGRFDRHVVLDSPDVRGREAILAIHGRNKPLAPDVQLSDVAKRTPGFTGADLANVMNEAALLAARRRRTDISRREVEEAVERVVAGPERRSRVIGPAEKKILAFHELGHALVAKFTPEADPVAKVSIIPRGRGALGYTLTLPTEDRYIITKDQLLARIRVALGGRSAEELVFGHQSTGAEDDLQKVTQLSRALVCRFGMTDSLGPVTYDRTPESPFLGREPVAREMVSERTADLIDVEVRRIVDECHKAARAILVEHRDVLDALAIKLIEIETLSAEDFDSAIKDATTRRQSALSPSR